MERFRRAVGKVSKIIHELKLDNLSDQPVRSLSGGQKAAGLSCTSFCIGAQILLLDEPTSALDIRHQLVVMETVAEYCQSKTPSLCMVVHDLMLASRFSDSVLFLNNGTMHAFDHPESVLNSQTIDPIYNI